MELQWMKELEYLVQDQFQTVLGAIDWIHIHITAPQPLHQTYYNQKGI